MVGCQVLRLAHPDQILLPGLRWRSCRMSFAWGAALAAAQGIADARPGRSPQPSAPPDQVRGLCRPGDPLPSRLALAPCAPGLAEGQGCSAALRFKPSYIKENESMTLMTLDPERAAYFQWLFAWTCCAAERVGRVLVGMVFRPDDERYLSPTDLYDAVRPPRRMRTGPPPWKAAP